MHSLSSTEAFTSRHKGLAFAKATAVAWLGAQFNRFTGTRAARRRAARNLETLYLLSDYELRDMGISRSDFPAIMAGTYRRF